MVSGRPPWAGPLYHVVGQLFLSLSGDRGNRYASSQRQLLRSRPDEELTRRVVTVRAYELPERTLDLGPGLLLFGVAEPDHELAQGQRSPRVLHGLSEGGKAPPNRNRVDGYLLKASRSVGVL